MGGAPSSRPPSVPRLISRPLEGDADWWRLRALLTELVPLVPPGFVWDVRRLDGSRYYDADPDRNPEWQTNTQLWETGEGRLVGAVNHDSRGMPHLQVHPDFRQLEAEMIEWAESVPWPAEGSAERTREVVAFEHDEQRQRLLADRSYEQTDDWIVTRRLRFGDRPLARPELAEGYTLRTTRPRDPDDSRQIADILNAAFGRSFHTAGEYRAFARSAPSFVPELDLVAVASDGAFGSYVGVPYDEANRRGIFEPVCTHPGHRRKGLARALMEDALLRLEARGAVDAIVETGAQEAANALYARIGFTDTYKAYVWRKAL